MHKKLCCLFFGFLLLACLSGCSSNPDDQDIKSQISAMLDSYQQGDMTKMETYTILGQSASVASDVQQYVGDSLPQVNTSDSSFFSSNEVIALIAKQSKFSIGSISAKNDSATVGIVAETPDMKTIINNLLSLPDIQSMSNDDMLTQLKQAIESGKNIKSDFNVSLEKVNNIWLADSSPISFKNGLTGGLYSGYQQLYLKALQEAQQSITGGSK